jgi:hypothetical protein
MQPVYFPDQSGDPVSYNTVSDFLADGYADPVTLCTVATHIQYQIPVYIGSSLLVTVFEVFVRLQRFHPSDILPSDNRIKEKGHIAAAFISYG